MSDSKYDLKTGQINFQNKNTKAFVCVVIKEGKFHNLQHELRQQLLAALTEEPEVEKSISLDDMF